MMKGDWGPNACMVIAILAGMLPVSVAQADSWDPADDSAAGATVLPAPTETPALHGPHTMGEPGDYTDWFALPLEAGTRYVVRAQDTTGDVLLMDVAVGLLILQYPYYFTPMCTDTYRVQIIGSGLDVNYDFHYAIANPAPEMLDAWDASDDLPGGATVLPAPTWAWQSHGPHLREGIDWFTLTLRAGDTVAFHTPENRCGHLYTAADVQGACEVDLPATLAFLAPWGNGLGARLTWVPESDGVYYLQLTDNCAADEDFDDPYTLRYRAIPPHTADQNRDGHITLTELLRVIQFYNVGGLHCAPSPVSTEDGYAPGAGGDSGCEAHASDYAGGADWHIALSEVLRVIQFFNAGGVTACPFEDTEDGYCPGA
ncbi:hypothetical protein [Roseovarius pacificus]|uniref:hypothetical protein n=1 Tax=Roseovarius pacificus TaxID=337701 RepID=UPI002A18E7AB|nr:hypothetical protein [Roseovarius pacificus]